MFNEVVQEGKKKGAPEASLLESLFKEEIIKVRNPNNKEYLKSVKEMAAENEMTTITRSRSRGSLLGKRAEWNSYS